MNPHFWFLATKAREIFTPARMMALSYDHNKLPICQTCCYTWHRWHSHYSRIPNGHPRRVNIKLQFNRRMILGQQREPEMSNALRIPSSSSRNTPIYTSTQLSFYFYLMPMDQIEASITHQKDMRDLTYTGLLNPVVFIAFLFKQRHKTEWQ